jgi:hypothetical protein
MKLSSGLILAALATLAMAGCGGSNQGGSTADNAKPAANAAQQSPATEAGRPAVAIAAAETASPQQAVGVFLEAVRKGDDQRAEAMLTPIAREKTKGLGIQVAPKGSDTANFAVGTVEMVGTEGARVQSQWTDYDETGQQRTDEILWMLRKEEEGWRVAGMATVVFAGEDRLLLDFENPEETMQRLAMLKEEIAKRAQTAATGTNDAQPTTTGGSGQAATPSPPEFPDTTQASQPGISGNPVRR